MKGFKTNIELAVAENGFFRKVLYTSKHLQLVVMTLYPEEVIDTETHIGNDQFVRVESGVGVCTINGEKYTLSEGDIIVIPAGSKHKISNVSQFDSLKLYTLYTPPVHKKGTIHKTIQEAEAGEKTKMRLVD
jgi:mannose-6-phosphate isomerase-like protein (cupin superfamily)